MAESDNGDVTTLEDTYVMGHRLVTFLSMALPKHPEYLHGTVEKFRNRTFHDLVWINDRMEQLALKIDEEQLNHFITDEFVPEPDDDDSSSSTSSSSHKNWVAKEETGWENFGGWSFDVSSGDDTPAITDTDTSSLSEPPTSRDHEGSDSEQEGSDAWFDATFLTFEKTELDEAEHAEESDPSMLDMAVEEQPSLLEQENEFENDYDSEEDDEDYYDTCYAMHDALHVSEFLRKIAEEDVRFETDSEAADSWAQGSDCGSVALSGASSGSALTCDPARLALREIINKSPSKRKNHLLSVHPPPPPPANTKSSRQRAKEVLERQDECQEHEWASFDFATVRRTM